MKKLTRPILLVGTPETTPDLPYATGFWAPDPVVALCDGQRRELVVSELEQGRAEQLASGRRGLHVHTPGSLGLEGRKRRRLSQWALALLRAAGAKAVLVSPSFPHGVAVALEKAGIRVQVAKDALFPSRATKSDAEIACIRESQRAAAAAMRAAVATIRGARIDKRGFLRSGNARLRAEAVQACVHHELLARRCLCRDVIVAGGRQAADPHERGRGVLRAHEGIVIDIFPQHMESGYWGDVTRTVVRGRAPEALRRMHAAVREAHGDAMARITPRAALRSAHAAAEAALKRHGFVTESREGRPVGFIHSTGHGVGLAIHEAPSIAPVPGRFRAGQVVTVEPGLYYPDIGGVRLEDTLRVKPAGCEILVPLRIPFEL